MYGRRVPKTHPRVEAYGCVDELTAALGIVRSSCSDASLSEQILTVQKDLIVVMGELATDSQDRERYIQDGFQVTSPEMVDHLTDATAELEKDKSLYPKDWVIPGNTPLSAALDIARTTCRRAERRVAGIMGTEKDFNPEIVRYLNRLSDLCWLLARSVEKAAKEKKTP